MVLGNQSSASLRRSLSAIRRELRCQPTADQASKSSTTVNSFYLTRARLAHPVNSLSTLRASVRSALLATSALVRRIRPVPPSSITTMVTGVPRATTALKEAMSRKNVIQASLTLRRARKALTIVNSVLLVPSRTSLVKQDARFVANSLILQKVQTSASVLVIIELTRLEMPLADARVALTTSMSQSSRKVMSVI